MPDKKKAAPAAAKKAAKPAAKPAVKAAPAKKVVAKPAPKTAAAKKAAVKTAAKPVARTAVKSTPKPAAKVAPAPAPAKKAVAKPVKTAPVKVAPAPKKLAKPAAKPVAPAVEKTVVPANKAVPAPKKELSKTVLTPAKVAKKKEETPAKPVKVPKTTATGKVPYNPDFTHSVLDKPREEEQIVTGTPTQRYSDSDLAEFRELIHRKLEAAKKELAYLQGLITRKDEMGGDNDDARYMTMEDGSLSMEREQLSQMASRQITFVDHLEKALIRIENKTYGICRVTGKLIDKARLRAVPHATLSVEAKMGKVKQP